MIKPVLKFGAAALILSSISSPILAKDGYFQEASEGWFWYKDPVEEVEVEPEPVLPPEPKPIEEAEKVQAKPTLQPGSVAWLREAMPIALDLATDDPSPQNVERYFYLQKMAADKAEVFSEVAQLVTTGHPELDEGRRRPRQDTFAKRLERDAEAAKRKVLSTVFKTSALVLFVDESCSGCGLLADNLFRMSQTHGLVWKVVSLDGTVLPDNFNTEQTFDDGLAGKLGVAEGGAVFLATPPSMFTPVTWNPTGGAEIADRVLMVARRVGIISNEQFDATRAVNPMIGVNAPTISSETPEILTIADRIFSASGSQRIGAKQ